METHSFYTEHAKEYGINEALLIFNFRFWILKNRANRKHFYEDRYWTYNSVVAFGELFPYLTNKKIRIALASLIEKEVLITGNFHPDKANRSLWYAFKNEAKFLDFLDLKGQMDLPYRANALDLQGKCITDTSTTDNNTISKPVTEVTGKKKASFEDQYKAFIKLFNELTGKKARGCDKSKRQFKARLENGYKGPDFIAAIKNCWEDKHHIENRKYLTPEFITRAEKLEMYLNAKPETPKEPEKPKQDYNKMFGINPNWEPPKE
jgi:uncharacterized phage protein (TIGR02220 family)